MTMRCFLLNAKEAVIYAFDAADADEARQTLLDKTASDGTNYSLAVVVRTSGYSLPPAQPVITDTEVVPSDALALAPPIITPPVEVTP